MEHLLYFWSKQYYFQDYIQKDGTFQRFSSFKISRRNDWR